MRKVVRLGGEILHQTSTLAMGIRLIIILHKIITWTSGEVYHPGPDPNTNTLPTQEIDPTQRGRKKGNHRKTKRNRHTKKQQFKGDVRCRFHNVQGLSDKRFRPLYLERARSTCDILGIAEANWTNEVEAQEWGKDWSRSGGTFYVGRIIFDIKL